MARSRGSRKHSEALSKYAKGRVRGKNGRFAMDLEGHRNDLTVGFVLLVILVVVIGAFVGLQ